MFIWSQIFSTLKRQLNLRTIHKWHHTNLDIFSPLPPLSHTYALCFMPLCHNIPKPPPPSLLDVIYELSTSSWTRFPRRIIFDRYFIDYFLKTRNHITICLVWSFYRPEDTLKGPSRQNGYTWRRDQSHHVRGLPYARNQQLMPVQRSTLVPR